jgi:hypothetical protein
MWISWQFTIPIFCKKQKSDGHRLAAMADDGLSLAGAMAWAC